MRLLLISLFLIVVLGVLLATQPENLDNKVELALPFIGANWTGPVLWMIAGWFGAGLGLGYLIGLPGRIRSANRARKVEKELQSTSTERAKAVGHLNEAAPARVHQSGGADGGRRDAAAGRRGRPAHGDRPADAAADGVVQPTAFRDGVPSAPMRPVVFLLVVFFAGCAGEPASSVAGRYHVVPYEKTLNEYGYGGYA